MRVLLVASLVPLAAFVLSTSDPIVKRHVDASQKATSLDLVFTETIVGEETTEFHLFAQKPNKFRLEGPNTLIVGDGKSIWKYNDLKNSYLKLEATPDNMKKTLGENRLIAWSAFFDAEFADQITDAVKGATRKVRNKSVTDVSLTLKDGRSFSLSFEDTTGIAFGGKFVKEGRASKSEIIILGKEMKLGEAIEDSKFTFTIPADAKDEAAAPVAGEGLKFADVKMIIDQNCAGCHSGERPKGRYDMSSYAGVMQGVKAGSPDTSRMMREINRGKMPPPPASMAQDAKEKLAKWIADGAQN
ncbi:MAG: c-type cytochrome domain-containing protein [Fimbriimonadaceae bacterium]